MRKIFIFFLGFLIGFIFFIPKDNLYFTLQKFLTKEKIYINSEITSNNYLKLKNGIIYYNGMDIINFDEIKVYLYLLFNKIYFKNLLFKFGDIKIINLYITYSILNPFKVYITGNSNFGKIKGNVNLIHRNIKIYIFNLHNENLKNFLQKDKKGYFYYETF